MTDISVECFPPITPQRMQSLEHELGMLAPLKPEFVSVTCGASIPASLAHRFTAPGVPPEESTRAAVETGAELCARLLERGVRGLHFYTMNRGALTLAICKAARLLPAPVDNRTG